jgi:hypothetical protein
MKKLTPVTKTGDKKNPYLATSEDGLNMAYGKTPEEARRNLVKGIEQRKKDQK